jgi:hypothetical protein
MEYREFTSFGSTSPKWTKGGRRAVVTFVVASLFLAFASSPAEASVERHFSPPTARFVLPAGNGYQIAVERFRNRVSLSALHGGKSFFAATTYTVPGEFSAQRLEANFGKFGRVSVRLKTERMHKGKLEEQCTGKPETVRYGTFVGTIRFRGEGGYASVTARQAEGRTSTGEKMKCVFPNLRPGSGSGAHASRQVPPSLTASQGRRRVFAVEFSGGKRRSLFFSAFSQEQRGRLGIFRDVFAEAPLSSFVFASDLSSATVQPPQPFQGEASFQRTAGPTWSGTLSVDFPGLDGVRLAGPRFEADLLRDDSSSTSIFFSGR